MSDVPADWIRAALQVTGHFEDSSQPLAAVTGDFDGMGISLGVLQWNIGSGSLQPMVLPLGQATVLKTMPVYGRDLWRACSSNIQAGLGICRGWQTGATLRQPVRAELRAFTGGPDFVARQIDKAGEVARRAHAAAAAYAAEDPAYGDVTKALFCWFFDVYTQNGGLKGLRYADVKRFETMNGISKVDDVVCDWLATRADGSSGYRDARENAKLWRGGIGDGRLSLFVLSYLRAQLARVEYRGDVLNRKATVALRSGWVHREKHDLGALLA